MNWVVCGVIELESVNYAFNYLNPVTGSLLSKENAVVAYLNEVFVRRGDGVDNESPLNAISISYNIRCCARSEVEKKKKMEVGATHTLIKCIMVVCTARYFIYKIKSTKDIT